MTDDLLSSFQRLLFYASTVFLFFFFNQNKKQTLHPLCNEDG